jgi:hypothetical protein
MHNAKRPSAKGCLYSKDDNEKTDAMDREKDKPANKTKREQWQREQQQQCIPLQKSHSCLNHR